MALPPFFKELRDNGEDDLCDVEPYNHYTERDFGSECAEGASIKEWACPKRFPHRFREVLREAVLDGDALDPAVVVERAQKQVEVASQLPNEQVVNQV